MQDCKMKTKLLHIFLLLLIVVLSYSCDRPKCKNTNPIFNQFASDTEEYKSELAKQIKRIGLSNMNYWFDKSPDSSEKELYELFIQSNDLCAKIIVENKTNRKRLGAGGYSGAELKRVIIKIKHNSAGTNFILENIDKIID